MLILSETLGSRFRKVFFKRQFAHAAILASSLLCSNFALGEKKADSSKELIAVMETNHGTMKIKLFHEKAPKTVSNFVGLARKGDYAGLIFHRGIPKFMIQGGDPKGDGTGGPGYNFEDEFHMDLRHSKAGMLSMANSGPNTNGSQFFITVAPTPHLDDRHTVFAEIIDGVDIATKISELPTEGTKPKEEVKIVKLAIQGDWFKPTSFEKLKELTEDEIKKMTNGISSDLLSKIGESQKLGKLKESKLEGFRNRGSKAQVAFTADFEKSYGVRLVLLGDAQKGNFTLKQFQFSMGKDTPPKEASNEKKK